MSPEEYVSISKESRQGTYCRELLEGVGVLGPVALNPKGPKA